MRFLAINLLLLIMLGVNAQDRRGVYQKRSCFCENHSNENGFYFGGVGAISQNSFQNNQINSNEVFYGGGMLIGNKFNENLTLQVEIILMKNQSEIASLETASFYSGYHFQHINVPISLLYRFNLEKRIAPYLLAGTEINSLYSAMGIDKNDGTTQEKLDDKGFNQFNLHIGAGTYVLSGDHLGFFIQGGVNYCPMESNFYSNYQYSFTGKLGLTYHL